ncbi:MAG: acyl-CoA thioesterase [Putridiphycobacter sp.]
MKAKTPKETEAISTKIVLPNDTNPLNNLFGGRLLAWMDEIAYISANRHSRRVAVTASINNVSFNESINLGDTITLKAKVSRAFNSSMEVIIDVYTENKSTGEIHSSNQAIYTFVAVDQFKNPIAVPPIEPETEQEKERYAAALRRKQLSLILAGKLKPSEATELKALFVDPA